MKLLRGRKIANKILADIKLKIKRQKLKPCLAVILIGENKASKLYIKLKAQAAKKVGIGLILYEFKSGVKEKEIIKSIRSLNKDKKINGIIVQLPLPKKYRTQKIISAISPQKNADGFSAKGGSASGGHPKSYGLFSKYYAKPLPVLPHAIMLLVESSKQKVYGKRAVVLTNSHKFGSVMIKILKQKGVKADYILAREIKNNLAKIKEANIVVTAVGKPKIIKGEMIKRGAVIIDGGITKRGKKVFGDVDFNSTAGVAGYLSPVPGGVGPVTVARLLENVYRFSLAQGRKK